MLEHADSILFEFSAISRHLDYSSLSEASTSLFMIAYDDAIMLKLTDAGYIIAIQRRRIPNKISLELHYKL